jgi:hypothetical protein
VKQVLKRLHAWAKPTLEREVSPDCGVHVPWSESSHPPEQTGSPARDRRRDAA